MSDNLKLEITKKDFLNYSQKSEKEKINNHTVIEMSNLDNQDNIENNVIDENNTNNINVNNNESSNDENSNDEIISKIEKIQTELDDVKLEGEEELDDTEVKPTFDIPKYSMIEYLQDKNKNIQDKQTIYEYYYENLNVVYSKISICLIIFSSLVTLFGSTQLGDSYLNDTGKYGLKICVIVLSFVMTILSSVLKFQLYKEKIESIGKYMEQLEVLIDDIDILIKKIELTKISDQEFFKQLENISIIVTRTNSKLFNIKSDKYYEFYRKLKYISSNKWDIQHQIRTNNETKYNDFLKKRLDTMKERLELKREFKKINDVIKKENITSFYNSDIFSYSKSTENREE